MKFSVITITIIALFVLTGSRSYSQKSKTQIKTFEDSVAYVLGYQWGKTLMKDSLLLDLGMIQKGFHDAFSEKPDEFKFSSATVNNLMKELQARVKERRDRKEMKIGKLNLELGKKFLAENAKKDSVKTTPSGLQYKIIKEGTGPKPKANSTVTVNYRGTLIDGKVFDSSIKRGKPATFNVSGVIKGWTEALQMMKTGAKWILYIPSDLAYGNKAVQNIIPPNSTLIFEVELLEVKDAPQTKK